MVLLLCLGILAAARGAESARAGRPVFSPTPPAPAPVPVASLTLTNVEAAVAQQFKEARAEVDRQVGSKTQPLALAESWGLLGKTYVAYRLLGLGTSCFTNALVAMPTHAPSWYALAACRFEMEQNTLAFEAVGNALACLLADPGSPPSDLGEARRLTGDILDRMGRLEEALEQFDKEHLGEPGDSYSPIRAVQVLLRMGRAQEALRRLDPMARVSPRNMTVRALVAEAYERMGEKDKATALLSGMSRELAMRLTRLDRWWASVLPLNKSAASIIQEAVSLMQVRRFRAALVRLQAALAINPKNLVARTHVANCRLRLKEYQTARSLYAEIVREDPKNELARGGLAIAMAQSGDRVGAYELCRKWLESEPRSTTALFADSEVRRAVKDYAGAEKSLRLLVELEPKMVANRRALANTLFAAGKGPEAIEMQVQWLRANPLADDVGLQIARALVTSRDRAVRNPEAALTGITEMLRRGTNLPLIETQALALGALGKWTDAEAALKSVQDRVETLTAARTASAGVPAEEDEAMARFRIVESAVARKVEYFEPWPFAEVDTGAAGGGGR